MWRLILFVCGLFVMVFACQKSEKNAKLTHLDKGKEASKQYCAACHKYPEPDMLTKSLWKDDVLPKMAQFMGIWKNPEERNALLQNGEMRDILLRENIYPEHPMMDAETFRLISEYYISQAPEKFTFPEVDFSNSGRFMVEIPPNRFRTPSTTLLKAINSEIWLGDANTNQFLVLNSDKSIQLAAELEEGAVSAEVYHQNLYVTVMGSFSPTELPLGMLVSVPYKQSSGGGLVMDKLQRPVHSAACDLDRNNITDFVICEFGQFTGALNWYKGLGNGKFEKITLHPKPGAIRSYIRDVNNDGLQDVVTLFAQADEGIDAYINEGNDKFKRVRLLSFPPGYGSSSFELTDLNRDGNFDIVYTAGDNADFNPIPRPYHGIYHFTNDGNLNFKQSYFYHLPGAYAVRNADFDLDGDMDMAAISFFPDFDKHPERGFVYLENKGNHTYASQSMPIEKLGRWLLMDISDDDQDGDLDIYLGSLSMQPKPDKGLLKSWTSKGIPYIILKNNTK